MLEACSKIGTAQHMAIIQADTLGEKLERAINNQAEMMDKRLTTALNALAVSNPRAMPRADTD